MKNILRFLTLLVMLLASPLSSQWIYNNNVSGLGPHPCISSPSKNAVWVAGSTNQKPKVYRSTNMGFSYVDVTSNLSSFNRDIYCVYAIDANTCYVGDGGSVLGNRGNANVYRTTDGGMSWNIILSTSGNTGFIKGIVFSKTHTNVGVCLSSPLTGPGGAFWLRKTTDGGVTWSQKTAPGLANQDASQNALAVIDENFYGFGTRNVNNTVPCYITWTTNGGIDWSNFLFQGNANEVTSFAVSSDKNYAILTTNEFGPSIYSAMGDLSHFEQYYGWNDLSGKASAKWLYGTDSVYIGAEHTSLSDGAIIRDLPFLNGQLVSWKMTTSIYNSVYDLDIINSAGHISGFSVDAAGNILTLYIATVGVHSISGILPTEIKLRQNYPNPFNPNTKIQFDLPANSGNQIVKLVVHDILGKEIETIVNESLKPGSYEVNWDAGNRASGVYFYTLMYGDFKATKEMILMK